MIHTDFLQFRQIYNDVSCKNNESEHMLVCICVKLGEKQVLTILAYMIN